MLTTIRKRLKLMIIPLLLLSFVLTLPFNAQAEGVYLAGSMINRYVLDLEDGDSYDAFTSLDLDLEERIGPADLYLNPILTLDLDDHDMDTVLEEGYLDFYFDNFDLRLGKQKVTWGKADGVVVTNLVNSLDLTEYPTVEFEDKFQAVNSVKMNYYLGSDVLEMIWIPEFEPLGMEKDLFYSNLTQRFSNPVIDYSQKEVDNEFENSEFGLKYSSLGAGYDYELVAGYFWDDEPTIHLEQSNGNKIIIPRHHRLTMAGGSFSTTVGPFVVRGESAFIDGKHFNTTNMVKYQDGTVEKNQLKLLVAGDYYLGDYLLSLQVLDEMILDYEESIENEEHSQKATFLISRDFLRDTLTTELTFFYDATLDELIAQPRVGYDYSDKINFEFGANYALEGGQRKDVLYLQSEYLF